MYPELALAFGCAEAIAVSLTSKFRFKLQLNNKANKYILKKITFDFQTMLNGAVVCH